MQDETSRQSLPEKKEQSSMKHFRSGAAILTALAVLLATGLPAKAADTGVSCVQQGVLQEHNGFLSMTQDHVETAQFDGRLRKASPLPAS